jgi:elongator complex protein 6
MENKAFLVGLAHQADLLIGCRGLDSGGAGDVSGVLRITTGGVVDEDLEGTEIGKVEWKEQELLYLVRNDSTAKVWERGAVI